MDTFSFGAHIDYTFVWSYGGSEVFVAGNYDNWTSRTKCVKNESTGAFEARMRLPASVFQYKFVVDGNWLYDVLKPTATDDKGNVNNLFDGRFLFAATVAKEVDRIRFVRAISGQDGRDQFSYLTLGRTTAGAAGDLCESSFPWHGAWEFCEHTPENVVARGRWSMTPAAGQRCTVTFESPGIPQLGGISSASYDRSSFILSMPNNVVFSRKR